MENLDPNPNLAPPQSFLELLVDDKTKTLDDILSLGVEINRPDDIPPGAKIMACPMPSQAELDCLKTKGLPKPQDFLLAATRSNARCMMNRLGLERCLNSHLIHKFFGIDGPSKAQQFFHTGETPDGYVLVSYGEYGDIHIGRVLAPKIRGFSDYYFRCYSVRGYLILLYKAKQCATGQFRLCLPAEDLSHLVGKIGAESASITEVCTKLKKRVKFCYTLNAMDRLLLHKGENAATHVETNRMQGELVRFVESTDRVLSIPRQPILTPAPMFGSGFNGDTTAVAILQAASIQQQSQEAILRILQDKDEKQERLAVREQKEREKMLCFLQEKDEKQERQSVREQQERQTNADYSHRLMDQLLTVYAQQGQKAEEKMQLLEGNLVEGNLQLQETIKATFDAVQASLDIIQKNTTPVANRYPGKAMHLLEDNLNVPINLEKSFTSPAQATSNFKAIKSSMVAVPIPGKKWASTSPVLSPLSSSESGSTGSGTNYFSPSNSLQDEANIEDQEGHDSKILPEKFHPVNTGINNFYHANSLQAGVNAKVEKAGPAASSPPSRGFGFWKVDKIRLHDRPGLPHLSTTNLEGYHDKVDIFQDVDDGDVTEFDRQTKENTHVDNPMVFLSNSFMGLTIEAKGSPVDNQPKDIVDFIAPLSVAPIKSTHALPDEDIAVVDLQGLHSRAGASTSIEKDHPADLDKAIIYNVVKVDETQTNTAPPCGTCNNKMVKKDNGQEVSWMLTRADFAQLHHEVRMVGSEVRDEVRIVGSEVRNVGSAIKSAENAPWSTAQNKRATVPSLAHRAPATGEDLPRRSNIQGRRLFHERSEDVTPTPLKSSAIDLRKFPKQHSDRFPQLLMGLATRTTREEYPPFEPI